MLAKASVRCRTGPGRAGRRPSPARATAVQGQQHPFQAGELHRSYACAGVPSHRIQGPPHLGADDGIPFQRQHDHAVLGQPLGISRLAEAQPVGQGAEVLLVVHVRHLVAASAQGGFGRFVLDARGGGHVHPFRGPWPVLVVDQLEVHGAIAFAFPFGPAHSGGAVRLVGEGQVELRRPVPGLGGGDLVQRVVGGEHNPGRSRAAQDLGDPLRGRRHLSNHLMGCDVAAGGAVRADDDGLEAPAGVEQPFGSGPGGQGDGRDRERDATTVRDQFLSGAQAGEGLASAAGHDQPAPVVFVEPAPDACDGVVLLRPEFPWGVGLALVQHRGPGMSHEVDGLGRHSLAFNRLVGGVGPWAGGDQPSAGEEVAAGFGVDLGGIDQELVDLAAGHLVLRVVALALDGDQQAAAVLRHQVDAHVPPVGPGQPLAVRPVRPGPDVIDVELALLQGQFHEQPLEPAALLRLGAAFQPDAVQFAATEGGAVAAVPVPAAPFRAVLFFTASAAPAGVSSFTAVVPFWLSPVGAFRFAVEPRSLASRHLPVAPPALGRVFQRACVMA